VGVVAGATDIDSLQRVRELSPNIWILCPGVGAQGGEAEVREWSEDGIPLRLMKIAVNCNIDDTNPRVVASTDSVWCWTANGWEWTVGVGVEGDFKGGR